jgi:hypothetical protein
MLWWSEGIETSHRMVISYDNLIKRLWLQGAIVNATITTAVTLETLLNDNGMPPVPHKYWISRLGFQQPDPVTDFRSVGVLSLAMMVWMVESCPHVFRRFARVPVMLSCTFRFLKISVKGPEPEPETRIPPEFRLFRFPVTGAPRYFDTGNRTGAPETGTPEQFSGIF